MNIYKKIIFNFFLIFTTYLLFLFPVDVLKFLLIKESFLSTSTLLTSLLIYLLFLIYFKFKFENSLLKSIIFQGMGIGFISFWISAIALLLFNLSEINSLYLGITSCILIIIFSVFGFINAKIINIKRIEISSKKISKEVNLVFISDVHLGSNPAEKLKKIIFQLKKLNFDILLIGGDLIDSSSFDLKNLNLFQSITQPILFVSGNHEHYLNRWDQISKSLIKFNINNIDGKCFEFKNINFIGVGDNLKVSQQKLIVKENYKKHRFNLILSHKPSLWKEVHLMSDLMLSGHTHKGQIFPFNFIVKLKFRELYGYFKKMESVLYVSSGISCWGPKIRLGSNNELVKININ